MEADNIDGKKEPKRLPVWACISLFIVVLFIFIGLYGTLVREACRWFLEWRLVIRE